MNQDLDAALTQLHAYGHELDNGLTNHAPMVAEALDYLGLASAIQPWVSNELSRCLLRPKHVAPIDAEHWRDALADVTRFSDWADLFQTQIHQSGWVATLQVWLPRLTPGFASAAAHCAIRVGHAARALRRCDTDARNLELADALAFWACAYTALPVSPSQSLELSSSRALRGVKRVEANAHSPTGSITAAIANLKTDSEFASYFYSLGIDDDPHELALDIGATFARLFCQSAQSVLGAIVFTHAITGIAAVRNLEPYLLTDQCKALLRHAFHTGCALHAVYSEYDFTSPVHEPLHLDTAECIYDALEHGDEHVIKLTEACVTFTDATGDAFFMTAAERCRRLLPARAR